MSRIERLRAGDLTNADSFRRRLFIDMQSLIRGLREKRIGKSFMLEHYYRCRSAVQIPKILTLVPRDS